MTARRRGAHSKKRAGGVRRWLAPVVSVAVLAAAGGVALVVTVHHRASASPTTTQAPPSVVTATGPPCPLTGVPAPGGAVPQRPALAIKVDNVPQARPQSGLDEADIVFEEPVEGGITRLVAVFQCQEAASVGDIRSARAVDAQILDQLSHPIFVHAGDITPVASLLGEASLYDENILGIPSIIHLNPDRVAPFSTYTSTVAGWGLEPSDTTPPTPLFSYGSSPPAGTAAGYVHIPFSQSSDETWTWSASAGRWLLSYSGQPAMLADGNQISATNVVIQQVQVSYGPWSETGCCSLEVQSHLTGSGSLLVLRNGQEISGTWQRSSLGSPTSLVSSTGTVIPLAPGTTWVDIVPESVTVSAG